MWRTLHPPLTKFCKYYICYSHDFKWEFIYFIFVVVFIYLFNPRPGNDDHMLICRILYITNMTDWLNHSLTHLCIYLFIHLLLTGTRVRQDMSTISVETTKFPTSRSPKPCWRFSDWKTRKISGSRTSPTALSTIFDTPSIPPSCTNSVGRKKCRGKRDCRRLSTGTRNSPADTEISIKHWSPTHVCWTATNPKVSRHLSETKEIKNGHRNRTGGLRLTSMIDTRGRLRNRMNERTRQQGIEVKSITIYDSVCQCSFRYRIVGLDDDGWMNLLASLRFGFHNF